MVVYLQILREGYHQNVENKRRIFQDVVAILNQLGGDGGEPLVSYLVKLHLVLLSVSEKGLIQVGFSLAHPSLE